MAHPTSLLSLANETIHGILDCLPPLDEWASLNTTAPGGGLIQLNPVVKSIYATNRRLRNISACRLYNEVVIHIERTFDTHRLTRVIQGLTLDGRISIQIRHILVDWHILDTGKHRSLQKLSYNLLSLPKLTTIRLVDKDTHLDERTLSAANSHPSLKAFYIEDIKQLASLSPAFYHSVSMSRIFCGALFIWNDPLPEILTSARALDPCGLVGPHLRYLHVVFPPSSPPIPWTRLKIPGLQKLYICSLSQDDFDWCGDAPTFFLRHPELVSVSLSGRGLQGPQTVVNIPGLDSLYTDDPTRFWHFKELKLRRLTQPDTSFLTPWDLEHAWIVIKDNAEGTLLFLFENLPPCRMLFIEEMESHEKGDSFTTSAVWDAIIDNPPNLEYVTSLRLQDLRLPNPPLSKSRSQRFPNDTTRAKRVETTLTYYGEVMRDPEHCTNSAVPEMLSGFTDLLALKVEELARRCPRLEVVSIKGTSTSETWFIRGTFMYMVRREIIKVGSDAQKGGLVRKGVERKESNHVQVRLFSQCVEVEVREEEVSVDTV